MSGSPTTIRRNGFSLIEVLIGTAIFLIVAMGVYGSFASLLKLANGSRARTLAVQLADEQFEIIRNLPYSSIGLTTGIPAGVLPQTQILNRGGVAFTVGLTIRNINLSVSTVQASNKLVEVNVRCPTCQDFQPVTLTGQFSPANLQSASYGGAVVMQVFDGNGEPVSRATVTMQSLATSTVTNTDVTNDSGVINIVGVPPGVNMYKVTVTKNGYSTDQTYAIGSSGNPNPTKPNLTVVDQQVTNSSFAIDKLSSIHFSSVTPLCAPVDDVHFSLAGAKQIGASVPKYFQNLSTDGLGILDLGSMEWDTYAITPMDSAFDLIGLKPFSPFTLDPGSAQNIQLVVLPSDPNSLMVTVVDNISNLPVSGAVVRLSKSGYDESTTTEEGDIPCIPPGQVIFQGLSTGVYTLNVSKSGYTTYSNPVTIESGWQEKKVLLAP